MTMPSKPARGHLLVLLCTSVPAFMLQLDANIVSVSLPAIARSLDASFAGIEWVVTAYMLSFASLLLPAGALADRFGRKRLLVAGLAVFTLASLLCGSAPNLSVLVAGRALQGAGAAMQLSASLAALSHAVHGEARARAFAFWGSVIGIGMASGPVVGGLITQYLGWEWAFYVNLPIGAALIVLAAKVIENSKDPGAVRLDLPGVLCFGTGLFLATFALIEGNHRGWADPWIDGGLTGALLFLAAFVLVELRQDRPMVSLAYFRSPSYLGVNVAQLAFSGGILTMLTFVPILLQSGLGHGPGTAGLMMLPMVLPLFLVPRLVNRHLIIRYSGRAILTLGLASVSVGLLAFAAVVRLRAYEPMVPGMLLIGSGSGLLNSETTKIGMSLIPRERGGMASGIAGTMRFMGISLGLAALGAVLYGRVASMIAGAMPDLDAGERLRLIGEITAGDLSRAGTPALAELAHASFAGGYQALFLASLGFMLVATFVTWRLVSATDTPPVVALASASNRKVLA
ncbi:MFS transporter [Methylobacterium sp. J-048]|uniref:MFS transporter n=1 Tax=Methylobacterium sp. J-048 TaxID=2836635 RepID=UPI001FBA6DFB|nr:MFS transporter [Methylobacterium sp. J-048]MCJ2058508.1 MFS transporter [Methylobacterium sp. J-048]